MKPAHASPASAFPLLPPPWATLLARLNSIAAHTDIKMLMRETLALLCEVCRAENGAICEYHSEIREITCHAGRGSLSKMVGSSFPLDGSLLAEQAAAPQVRFFPRLQAEPGWKHTPGAGLAEAQSLLVVPFHAGGKLVALGEILDPQNVPWEQITFLSARLSTEIHKAFLLLQRWRDNARLQALIAVLGEMSSTLDQEHLLRLLITYAAELLDAEASSLFLLDENAEELVLHLASNWQEVPVEKVRIPAGKGIIGEAVSRGEIIIVHETESDQRHYPQVDTKSGFVTRSVLAVPLQAQALKLGQGMGEKSEGIIGGLEAINKQRGRFTQQDAHLLSLLAQQAATILSVADLYADANELFLDVIQALVASIDAKDPYTEGHSRRVSEFSVAIAEELGLSPEYIHQVRIGSLLHDVGKIGIPDYILGKPGRLTEEEFARMKEHPSIGRRIMEKVRLLERILPAIEEHHERLDGAGYPHGLPEDRISLLGRIVAVADVFDALTSDRPYRDGLPAEEVLDYLHQQAGKHFASDCVQALTRAYMKGKIYTQRERDALRQAEQDKRP